MPHDTNKYLEDIRLCIIKIEEFISEIDNFEMYQNNLKTKLAVERLLAIIGEAVSKLLKISKDLNISNKREIIAM